MTVMRSATDLAPPPKRNLNWMGYLTVASKDVPFADVCAVGTLESMLETERGKHFSDDRSDNEEEDDDIALQDGAKVPWYIVSNKHPLRQRWDLFMVFLILYTFFFLPARIVIGFGGGSDEGSPEWTDPWTLSDLIMDLLFCIDLALNFITSVSTPNGLITDFSTISLLYLRSWFVIDFFSSLPLDLLVQIDAVSDAISSFKRYIKLIRLLKLVRLRRLKVYYTRLKDTLRVHPIWWTVLEVLFVFLVLGHMLALGLYFSAQQLDGTPYTDKNWLTETYIRMDNNKSIETQTVANAPSQIRYIVSFYWAVVTMATLGFGDIKPYTTHEIVMVIICLTAGACSFAWVIGQITPLLASFNVRYGEYRDKVARIRSEMMVASVSSRVSKRIAQSMEFQYNNELLDIPVLLTNIPHSMRFDVISRMCKSLGCFNVQLHPLFTGLNSGLQTELFLRMQPFYVDAGIHCFLREEVCADLFILVKGRCVVECPRNHLFVEAPAVMGASFIWYLCNTLAKQHTESTNDAPITQLYSMVSKARSAFYVIRHSHLQEVIDMYPKEVHSLCRRIYDLEKDNLSHLGIQPLDSVALSWLFGTPDAFESTAYWTLGQKP